MRLPLLCLWVLLLFPTATIPQGGHAKPPGIAAADAAANSPMEAPAKPGTKQMNVEQVNAEAQELQKLANGLPPQIDQVTKGQMPKDLVENLKRIERLAKHLRSELSP
jgi:hypothetical protein